MNNETIKKGLIKIKEKLALIYTLLIVLLIFFSFVFIFTNFVLASREVGSESIAIGATHQIFSEYASNNIDDADLLNEQIKNIAKANQTILKFQVILFLDEKAVIISALNDETIGKEKEKDIFYEIATINPEQSFTMEKVLEGEKRYETIKAIKDVNENIIGVIRTEQVLFQVDQIVSKNLQISIIVFIVSILLLMVLFFRYLKIADYPNLYEKAKKSSEMKDEFISMASHEIRTPLTAIRGYADMLKDFKINKEQEDFLNSIDTQTKRLDDLVQDLLDISKIEQDKIELELEDFDPKEEIEEVIKFLKYNAKQKNLQIYFKHNHSGKIKADKERLKQILINLIGNSIKYTEEGEVKIMSLNENDVFVIKVVDTGIGMSEEEQEKLFQKFYRIKSEKTEGVIGTGLGLWITKKLIDMMNGSISISSEKGKGTEVTITFPLI